MDVGYVFIQHGNICKHQSESFDNAPPRPCKSTITWYYRTMKGTLRGDPKHVISSTNEGPFFM